MLFHRTSLGLYPKNMGSIIDALTSVIKDPSTDSSCKKAFYDKLSIETVSQAIRSGMQQEVSRIMGTLWGIAGQKEDEKFIKALDKLQNEIDNLHSETSIVKVMIAARLMLKKELEPQKEDHPTSPVALALFNPITEKPEAIHEYALLAWNLFQQKPENKTLGEHIAQAFELLEKISSQEKKYLKLLKEIEHFTTTHESNQNRSSEVRIKAKKQAVS